MPSAMFDIRTDDSEVDYDILYHVLGVEIRECY